MSFLESGSILSASFSTFGSTCGSAYGNAHGDTYWLGQGKVERSHEPCDNEWSLYAPDFFLEDPKPWRSYRDWTCVSHEELCDRLTLLSKGANASALQNSEFIPPDRQIFASSFHGLKARFADGTLKKGVPVTFERLLGPLALEDRAWLLLQLLRRTRGLPVWLYGTWDEEGGIMGATPELLFRKDPSSALQIQTVALAGTRLKIHEAREAAAQEGELLLADPKEREEHQWVIRGISEALSGLGEVVVGETRLLELPTLFHLYTPIQLCSENTGFQELIQRLHPTPALGAFPKREGWKWLNSQRKGIDRARFGAPFGILKRGENPEALCVVGIRNLQWDREQVLIGAGCGVVQASVFEKEWAEVQGKILSVKRLFGLLS